MTHLISRETRSAQQFQTLCSGAVKIGSPGQKVVGRNSRRLNLNDPQQTKLKAILRKDGPVSYSYFDSPATDAATNDDTIGSALAGPVFKMSQVKQWLQQQSFRSKVFARHGKQCVVTKCKVEALLEAAHLHGRVWHAGDNTGDDGIPLRVDIHRAYDHRLITVDDEHRVSGIAPELLEQYGQYRQR